jgi:predicted RNase H-like HicB family nuclease
MVTRVRTFSLMRYVDTALSLAQYERDEDGVVVATVPDASGFFSQGDSFEEARTNLRDAIEGNVLLALQLGLPIPTMPGI